MVGADWVTEQWLELKFEKEQEATSCRTQCKNFDFFFLLLLFLGFCLVLLIDSSNYFLILIFILQMLLEISNSSESTNFSQFRVRDLMTG